jgi:cytochrome b involved in lipid metabolism
LWVVIDGDVFNLSTFASMHPGGAGPLFDVAGSDATAAFYGLHRGSILDSPKYAKLKVGALVDIKSGAGATGAAGATTKPVPYVASPSLTCTHKEL